MRKITALLALVCALATAPAAQKKEKPWTDWSKKDAEKILNDSAWGQTQTETDTSEMFYRPQGNPDIGANNPAGRDERGSLNQATNIKYHIRLFSARPIRQAFARLTLLQMEKPDKQAEERLKLFAEMPSNEKIVVAVDLESKDGRYSGPARVAFNSAATGTLKNNTYLEVKGKRTFLETYAPPGKDGFGALFIFPRVVDGQPVIGPDSGEVRFVSEVARGVRLNMRFKVSELKYNGNLEY